MPLKDMKDELKQLRKAVAMKPISKMKKSDIAIELEKLRGSRESTPAVDSTKATPQKKMMGKIADVKVAKENEFPVAPMSESKAKRPASKAMVEPKMSKKEKLLKMLSELSDSE